jgi:excisionase family DNA binding protein
VRVGEGDLPTGADLAVLLEQLADALSSIAVVQRRLAAGKRVRPDRQPRYRYSIREAAAYLGCSIKTVRRLLRLGHLPHRKDGRRYLIDLSEFEATGEGI